MRDCNSRLLARPAGAITGKGDASFSSVEETGQIFRGSKSGGDQDEVS